MELSTRKQSIERQRTIHPRRDGTREQPARRTPLLELSIPVGMELGTYLSDPDADRTIHPRRDGTNPRTFSSVHGENYPSP